MKFTNTAWKVMPLSMAAALGFPSCSSVTTASVCGKPAKAKDQIENSPTLRRSIYRKLECAKVPEAPTVQSLCDSSL
jgi:hypothetical protein